MIWLGSTGLLLQVRREVHAVTVWIHVFATDASVKARSIKVVFNIVKLSVCPSVTKLSCQQMVRKSDLVT